MNMTAAAMAVMILFSGQDLDGWITISGKWAVADAAIVGSALVRRMLEADDAAAVAGAFVRELLG